MDHLPQKWILLGRVGRPYGLRGEFFVSGRKETLAETLECARVVETTGQVRYQGAIRHRIWKRRDMFQLGAGDLDRSFVEAAHGLELWALRLAHASPQLETGSVVVYGQVAVGVVADVFNYGASDCATLRFAGTGAEVAIPVVADFAETEHVGDAVRLRLTRSPKEILADFA